MNRNSSFEKNSITSEFDKIIESLIKFKSQLDILNTWEKIDLDFSSADKKKNRTIIKSSFTDRTGFYAIFDSDECLYIGIGRPIWKRIYSHYKAANGFEKQIRWSEFFQLYKKNLRIYYKEFVASKTVRLDDKIRMLVESLLEQEYKPAFEFMERNLSFRIKFLAIEATTGSRYLLSSEKFPGYCLQVVVGEGEDYPQDRLLLIDSIIGNNCFRNFTDDEISNGARRNAISRLSEKSLEIIESIFKIGIGFKV